MMEDMHNYAVDADTVDIIFDEEELDDSDVEEDHHANENNGDQSKKNWQKLNDSKSMQHCLREVLVED